MSRIEGSPQQPLNQSSGSLDFQQTFWKEKVQFLEQ